MLTIPDNVQIVEIETSTMWFDEHGILCVLAKRVPDQTIEQARQSVARLKGFVNGKKVCMLVDVTRTAESSREVRSYLSEEMPTFARSVAIVSDSVLGKMLANLFFFLKPRPYPVKIFSTVAEAKSWLREYL